MWHDNTIQSKLSSQLKNFKNSTPFEWQHDIVRHFFSSVENFDENYIRESARQLNEKIKDDNGRDRNSHLFKHSVENGHDLVLKNDFRIFGIGYRNNTRRIKKAEAHFMKKMTPSLNIHEMSVKLELFNYCLFQKRLLGENYVIWKQDNLFALHINWLVTRW